MPSFITLRAVALLLAVSHPTAWRWAKAGKFGRFRTGARGMILVNVAELRKRFLSTASEEQIANAVRMAGAP